MIGVTVAMAALAVLFVVFGVLGLADGKGCDGRCTGCGTACENHVEHVDGSTQ